MALRISMPRGDIRPIHFDVKDPTGEPTEIVFDEIYFTVKKNYNNTDYLFQKRLSNGTIEADIDGGYNLVIEAADTDKLAYGGYVFDIELVHGADIKQTTVGD